MDVLLENLNEILLEAVTDDLSLSLKIVVTAYFTAQHIPEMGTVQQQVKAAKECLDSLKKKGKLQETYKQFKKRPIHPQTEPLNKAFLEQAELMFKSHQDLLAAAITDIKKPLNKLLQEHDGILEA